MNNKAITKQNDTSTMEERFDNIYWNKDENGYISEETNKKDILNFIDSEVKSELKAQEERHREEIKQVIQGTLNKYGYRNRHQIEDDKNLTANNT